MGDRKPRCPAGLGAAGKRLWRSVTGELDLRSDELGILEQAARTTDELAALVSALAVAEPMVSGSMGQPKPNPLFGEVRAHRDLLRRLLRSIEVEDQAADDAALTVGMSNSERSARLRWRAHRIETAARKADGS